MTITTVVGPRYDRNRGQVPGGSISLSLLDERMDFDTEGSRGDQVSVYPADRPDLEAITSESARAAAALHEVVR